MEINILRNWLKVIKVCIFKFKKEDAGAPEKNVESIVRQINPVGA